MKYRMDDGTVVDTNRATDTWPEDTRWDGSNYISVPTGSQFESQQLYRSMKGRYYLVHRSQWQGSCDLVEWLSDYAATAWLLENDYETSEIPEELAAELQQVSE